MRTAVVAGISRKNVESYSARNRLKIVPVGLVGCQTFANLCCGLQQWHEFLWGSQSAVVKFSASSSRRVTTTNELCKPFYPQSLENSEAYSLV